MPQSSCVRGLCFCVALTWCILIGVIVIETFNTQETVKKSSRRSRGGCNGHDELCNKPYTHVSFATAHNAFASSSDGFVSANNRKSMEDALAHGIRALMLDLHFFDDTNQEARLCHGPCELGSMTMSTAFTIIADFLEQNPNDVVTILWEMQGGSHVEHLKTLWATAVRESRLLPFLYTHNTGATWPTLSEMIRDNTRLVQFSDSGPYHETWDLSMWTYAVETPWSNDNKQDLDAVCTLNRGSASNPLLIVNHFFILGITTPILTSTINYNPYLVDRVQRCERELNKFPNFVVVDFWSYSDVIQAVECINLHLPVCEASTVIEKHQSTFFILIAITLTVCLSCSCMYVWYNYDSNTKDYEEISNSEFTYIGTRQAKTLTYV